VQKTERRVKAVKGSHLNAQFLDLAAQAGATVTPSKSGAFHVITGKAGKAKRIYLATRGGTVDLNGFTVEQEAFSQISEEEAKKMHLGQVRARLDFDKDDASVLAAFSAALKEIDIEVVKPAKPVRAPRVPKAAKAPVAEVAKIEITPGEVTVVQ
jgi:hypothetical protein